MGKRLVLTNGKEITSDGKCFIIAEIGQNHQGSMGVAKTLIELAMKCGADCVKFQKTCLNEKFNRLALHRPYLNKNSFAITYGEHKEHLEFDEDEFRELQAYADTVGIMFAATAMDWESLKFLIRLKLPFIKIGSGDANNILLLEDAAKANVPLIISTGMTNLNGVSLIYNTIQQHHKNFALLHCVSAYPTPPEQVHLKVIELLEEQFPDVIIGYSGHELGVDISVAAVAMGAKILERHMTLDQTWRGSDHCLSLEPAEFGELVSKVRLIETAFGSPHKTIYPCENACIKKLKKVIVLKRRVKKDHILQKNDLAIKVADPPGGMDGILVNDLIGKKVNADLDKDQPLLQTYLMKK